LLGQYPGLRVEHRLSLEWRTFLRSLEFVCPAALDEFVGSCTPVLLFSLRCALCWYVGDEVSMCVCVF
jgi:hypothetical protein